MAAAAAAAAALAVVRSGRDRTCTYFQLRSQSQSQSQSQFRSHAAFGDFVHAFSTDTSSYRNNNNNNHWNSNNNNFDFFYCPNNRDKIRTRKLRRLSSSSSTSLPLFCQDRQNIDLVQTTSTTNTTTTASTRPRKSSWISQQMIRELQSPNITFPFAVVRSNSNTDGIGVENDVEDEMDTATTTTTTSTSTNELYLRLMSTTDLSKHIVPMCIEEFGTGPTTTLLDFPPYQRVLQFLQLRIPSIPNSKVTTGTFTSQRTLSQRDQMMESWMAPPPPPPTPPPTTTTTPLRRSFNNNNNSPPTTIESWWDRLWLEPFITMSLTTKINRMTTSSTTSSSTTTTTTTQEQLGEPVLLVLCEKQRTTKKKQTSNNNKNDNGHDDDDEYHETIVGMVEISLQPIDKSYDRNPPAYPIPTWIKEQYANMKRLGPLEGWVTNLLVSPSGRSNGYGKILMYATEGIASSWGCHEIYLHADADITSGRIPQRLYQSLGYHVVEGNPKPSQARIRSNDKNSNDSNDNNEFAWSIQASQTAGTSPFSSSIRMVQGVPLLCYCKNIANHDSLETCRNII